MFDSYDLMVYVCADRVCCGVACPAPRALIDSSFTLRAPAATQVHIVTTKPLSMFL